VRPVFGCGRDDDGEFLLEDLRVLQTGSGLVTVDVKAIKNKDTLNRTKVCAWDVTTFELNGHEFNIDTFMETYRGHNPLIGGCAKKTFQTMYPNINFKNCETRLREKFLKYCSGEERKEIHAQRQDWRLETFQLF